MENESIKINIILDVEGEQYPVSILETFTKTPQGAILLNEIVAKLKQKKLHNFLDSSVSFLHEKKGVYVFGFMITRNISSEQLMEGAKYQRYIPKQALKLTGSEPCCYLRIRRRIRSKLDQLKEEQNERFEAEELEAKSKERSIAQVVEKVALWRKLYTGFLDEKGETVQFDLESAATEVGLIKKTLDDYLLQIRNGKRSGFDFHKMKKEKIGELRGFVRANKKDLK